jgi:serine/threonine protein kinase
LTNAGCSDGFAPPEQYLGLSQFTPQADIYAICATLLYLLTAKQPIKSSEINASIITKMLPVDTPPYISNAIINGMRRDKDDRTQSIESLADSLRINLSEEDNEGSLTVKLNIANKKKNKNRPSPKKILIWLFAICIISAIGGVIWYSNSSHSSQDALYDSDDPSIHYSKDILNKCSGLSFRYKTEDSDGYQIYAAWFLSMDDDGLSFLGEGEIIHFKSDVKATRQKNMISLSDKDSTLKIYVHKNISNIKVYEIYYSVNKNTSSYERHDFEWISYSVNRYEDVNENLSDNDYTAIDFIESLLKRLKFKINYE